MSINQAVIFTKPVHHLGISLSPEQLDALAVEYFEAKGFRFVLRKKVSGPELAQREVIKQHYLMYSKAACAASVEELSVSEAGKIRFESAFGKSWEAEVAAGRILPTHRLLETKGLNAHELFGFWNSLFAHGKTAKIQDGLIMAFLEKQDAYCINAFYPSMEANFYHPETVIYYYVVEFDPAQVSWKNFRKAVLGATNSSNADPASFRGQLYAEYPVEFPGRDNFVHGSAGPVEGFIERSIHEAEFDPASNPVGRYLDGRGLTLDAFRDWKNARSITELGQLFDDTEEIDTAAALEVLDGINFI